MAKGDKTTTATKRKSRSSEKPTKKKVEKEEEEEQPKEEKLAKTPVTKKKQKKKAANDDEEGTKFGTGTHEYTLRLLPACGALATVRPGVILIRTNENKVISKINACMKLQGFTEDIEEHYKEDKGKKVEEEDADEKVPDKDKDNSSSGTSLAKTPVATKAKKSKKKEKQYEIERGFPEDGRFNYELLSRDIELESLLPKEKLKFKAQFIEALQDLCKAYSTDAQRV